MMMLAVNLLIIGAIHNYFTLCTKVTESNAQINAAMTILSIEDVLRRSQTPVLWDGNQRIAKRFISIIWMKHWYMYVCSFCVCIYDVQLLYAKKTLSICMYDR